MLLAMLSLDKQNAWREHYRRMRPEWQPATERFAALVRHRLTPESRILDLGCGRGGLVEQLQHPLCKTFGVDPDEISLQEHRLNMPRVMGFGRYPFPNNTFDLIFASWVLEHWQSPLNELTEIRRMLKPGGVFVFITPNKKHPLINLHRVLGIGQQMQKQLVKRIYGREEDDTFPIYYRASSPLALTSLAGATGLELTTLDKIDDPTYLAITPFLFHLMRAVDSLLPDEKRLHLVGIMQKPPLR